MNASNVIGSIAQAAAMANPQAAGDYNKDGLLYCGKCHTAKQTRIPFAPWVVACQCKCSVQAAEDEKQAFEARQLREQIARYRAEAFHDKAMHQCVFDRDDMKNPALHKLAQNYAANFDRLYKNGKGLLLYGPCGTGKTFAAACIANALMDKGYSVYMTNFGRLINKLSSMQEDKQKFINTLCGYKLLILDDLGAERNTDYAQEIVFNVIDSRERAGRPMIVTTNLTANELQNPPDMTHNRIYSRLWRCCFPYEVKGADRRKAQLRDSFAEMKELLEL